MAVVVVVMTPLLGRLRSFFCDILPAPCLQRERLQKRSVKIPAVKAISLRVRYLHFTRTLAPVLRPQLFGQSQLIVLIDLVGFQ